jgi:hypothetical protein
LFWLSWKGFERLAWVLELDRKACSKPASKRFEELELALEVKLEGIIEAVLEEHREAGEDPGAGSRTHSRGFLREESGGCNGLWRWIRKTFPGLASKRCDGRARALEVDLEGIIKAGLEEIWKWHGRWIRKAFPRLASKGFKSLERHLELDLEGNLEAGLEEVRELGTGDGAGSRRQSRGWLRRPSKG